MSQKNILFLARLFSPHIGGVEKHVMLLSKELLKRGHTVTVLTEQYDEALKIEEMIEGIRIIRIPNHIFSNKWSMWWWVMREWSFFRQFDVVHAHDVFWWVLPISPFIRSKLFITFHGYEGSEAPSIKARMWHKLGEVMTSGNICIGGFHEKWYGISPDVISFGAISSQKNNTKKRKPKSIIYLGRLAVDAGILSYLEGFKLLQGKDKEWSLDVYGSGPQEKESRAFVEKHNLNVTFHGFVEDAAALLEQYPVAFVSRHLGILEALHAHTPVIAQYNNQIKEDYLKISPFAEWIQIVHSPQEICEAVLKVSPVSKNAFEWVHTQTWELMADHYEKLWRTA